MAAPLLRLPVELLHHVAQYLSQEDISAWSQANHQLFDKLDDFLYRHNIRSFRASALTWAAKEGKASVVEKMLRLGADVDITAVMEDFYEEVVEDTGRTSLSLAAQHGHEDVVRILLAAGADPDSRAAEGRCDKPELKHLQGRSPLMYACQGSHVDIARLLIDTGKVDVNAKTAELSYTISVMTPLSFACGAGSLELVQLLLQHDDVAVDFPEAEWMGRTPLWWAVVAGDVEIIKLLLDRGALTWPRIRPELSDVESCPPLILAAKHRRDHLLDLLMPTTDEQISVAIYEATSIGRGGLVAKLLDHYRHSSEHEFSEVSICERAMRKAVSLGYTDIVQHFLIIGVDPNVVGSIRGHFLGTLLCSAVKGGHVETVELLLTAGADVNQTNEFDQTPLHVAARTVDQPLQWYESYLAIVRLLLDRDDLEPNAKDAIHGTAFFYAAMGSCHDMVQLLIDSGRVDLDCACTNGRTALMVAAERGRDKIVKLLLDTGKVDPLRKSWTGRTALDYARASNWHRRLLQRGHWIEAVIPMLEEAERRWGEGCPGSQSTENLSQQVTATRI